MTRVLFFLPVLGGGGAEMHAVRLAEPLMEFGIEPVFATCRGGGSYEAQLPNGVMHHVLPTGGIDSGLLRYARAIRPLSKLIDDLKPDIVCPIMSMATLPVFPAVRLAKHNPRVVLVIQNSLRGDFRAGNKALGAVTLNLIRKTWPKADHVIALSRGVEEEIIDHVPSLSGRTSVVYNIGQPGEAELERAQTITPPIGRGQAAAIVACGRLAEQKDYPTLLKAFSKLRTEPQPELHILGTGPDQGQLESLAQSLGIRERVTFHGFRGDVLSFMGAADLFVLSSRWEGFGNVLVEAMAMETPVISTECPHGPSEIIESGVNGVLVPVEEPNSLAIAIEHLLTNPAQAAELAANGRERARRFSASLIGREYADAFKKIAGTDNPAD